MVLPEVRSEESACPEMEMIVFKRPLSAADLAPKAEQSSKHLRQLAYIGGPPIAPPGLLILASPCRLFPGFILHFLVFSRWIRP